MAATIERTGTPLGGSTRYTRMLRGKKFKEAAFLVSELPEKIREEVVERERYTYDHEAEWLSEQFLEDVRHEGYGDLEANWSAGFCQSDYVELYSKGGIDIDKKVIFRRILGAKKLKKVVRFLKRRGIDFFQHVYVSDVRAKHYSGNVEVEWESRYIPVGATFYPINDSGRGPMEGTFTSYKIGCWKSGKMAREFDENKGVDGVFRNGRDYLVACETDVAYTEKIIDELRDGILQDLCRLAREALDWLHKEIMWQHEDEQVISNLDANDRKFYRNGDEA